MTGGLELIKEAVEALSNVPDGDSCAKLFGKSNPSGDRIRRGEEQGMLVPLIVTLETSLRKMMKPTCIPLSALLP